MSYNRQFAIEVVQQLRDEGHQALWAGGCVRDELMGHPVKDYDVATSATPQQVRKLFGYRRTLPVGVSFGVVIVLGPTKDHSQIEVATFRTDATYSDGRRPDSVTFSTPEEDAQRRDFTINGMFYDPVSQHLIDYVDGQADLERKVIRAIGSPDHRIAEDKLRMLRAVRFAARFGFVIEPQTLEAIKRHSHEVKVVSGERIADEVRKTLVTPKVSWAVEQWQNTGLLRAIAPEVDHQWSNLREPILQLLDATTEIQSKTNRNWLLPMSAILWSYCHQFEPPVKSTSRESSPSLLNLRTHLKLSNEESESLEFAVHSQQTLEQASLKRWSELQPLLISPYAEKAIELIEARSHINAAFVPAARYLREKLGLPLEQLNPPPLLTGQSLLERGLRPSPRFGELLAQARAQQLDGLLADREAALEWLKTQL